MRLSIAIKLLLLTMVLSLVLIGVLYKTSYDTNYAGLVDKYGLALKHVAITTALCINGDDIEAIGPQGEKTPQFKKIKRFLAQVMTNNFLTHETLYIFRVVPQPDGKKQLRWAVMLHPKPFVWDPHGLKTVVRPHFEKVFAGQSTQTGVYEDQYGVWISGMAPIFNAEGRVSGVLEADFRFNDTRAAFARQQARLAYTSLGVMGLGLLVSLLIAYTFTRPVRKLREAAQAIRDGDYDVRLQIASRDEIGNLAQSFNGMAASLSERFHMLKYISPHTMEMISRLINKEISEEGETRNVTIFFSDIRGFTRFSEKRNPEEVVSMLNTFLGRQADIIKEYGGHIDKFVGDEVVAIFQGLNRDLQAARAGLAIHQVIGEINRSRPSDEVLQVGIGIANGDVIMGNIGSEERRDYTVIGSNVNLASRLCSGARGGEILITSDVKRSLEKTDLAAGGIVVALKGQARIKGFSQPVHIYTVEAALGRVSSGENGGSRSESSPE